MPASWPAHGHGGDHRGLLRRLGDHRVAGRQRGGDLAEEDRQREVPRADAGKHAAAVQTQFVRSPVGPGSSGSANRSAARGVVAAEIDRLAHFGQRIGDRLAASRTALRSALAVALSRRSAEAFEHGARARHGRARSTARLCGGAAATQHRPQRAWRRRTCADDVAMVGGLRTARRRRRCRLARRPRLDDERSRAVASSAVAAPRAPCGIGKVDAPRISAPAPYRAGQRDRGCGAPPTAATAATGSTESARSLSTLASASW